jgi:hypothetical protein
MKGLASVLKYIGKAVRGFKCVQKKPELKDSVLKSFAVDLAKNVGLDLSACTNSDEAFDKFNQFIASTGKGDEVTKSTNAILKTMKSVLDNPHGYNAKTVVTEVASAIPGAEDLADYIEGAELFTGMIKGAAEKAASDDVDFTEFEEVK